MYLSRLELNQNKRSTLKLLASSGNIHGAVEGAFEGARKRKLWRIDRVGEKLYLMILSEDIPKLDIARERYGTEKMPEIKDYNHLLDRITEGSKWRFRLVANPVKSGPAERGERGKIRACISIGEQEEWLLERAEKYGFAIERDDFTVNETDWKIFLKGEKRDRVCLKETSYEGILTVKDKELFIKALCEGIGRGKAFGMGMLTVVRV